MKILLTGATGFVGRAVVASLRDEHQVIALVREGFRPEPDLGCEAIPVDPVRDPAAMRSLPARVDAVVHLAHYRGAFPEEAMRVFESDTAMTLRLLEYARRSGASRFVYGSTGSVYGPRPGPHREEDPPDPANFYATIKYASELLLCSYKVSFQTCILRLFVPYGPGQGNRMIPNIAQRVLDRHPVILTNGGQPRTNPIYIDDLVDVFREALKLTGHHLLNIGGPTVCSVEDIARVVGRFTGVAPIFQVQSDPVKYDLVGDIRRMKKAFPALQPRDLEAGLRAMLDTSRDPAERP